MIMLHNPRPGGTVEPAQQSGFNMNIESMNYVERAMFHVLNKDGITVMIPASKSRRDTLKVLHEIAATLFGELEESPGPVGHARPAKAQPEYDTDTLRRLMEDGMIDRRRAPRIDVVSRDKKTGDEELACGHTVNPEQDGYRRGDAKKRHCMQCLLQAS